MFLGILSLFLLGVGGSAAEEATEVKRANTPVQVIDSNNMLTPIDQMLNHPYEGSYIDQVVGKDQLYTCQPEIVFVVDMSTSVGEDNIASQAIPLIRDILMKLAQLPNGDPSLNFNHNVHFVTFNKKAALHTVSLKGKTVSQVLRIVSKVLTDIAVKGGSCISCGLELAAGTLANVAGLRNKFLILISDGHDHDGLMANSQTPGEVSSSNRKNQIYHFSVAVAGVKKEKYNEPQLTQIAQAPTEDSYYTANTYTRRSIASLNIVDRIAGRTCMQIFTNLP